VRYARRDPKCQNCTLVFGSTASAQTCRWGLALILCFARYGGCVRVGFLSDIKAPAKGRRIFETSNLDACVMAPGPSAAHKPLARLTKQLDQRAPAENVRNGNRSPATAL
jgi:hypothetical protein